MSPEVQSQVYMPGEPVFLQGQKIPDYFKVLSGRFAKVRSNKPVDKSDVKRMLSTAELLGVVSHQELFGEIEALMGQPQPFSVFALDESSVYAVPATNPDNIKSVFEESPKIGVKTCVSFARFLKQFFSYLSKIAREECDIDIFLKSTARDYLALVNELKAIVGPSRKDSDIESAVTHEAFKLAHEISTQPSLPKTADSSVTCSVVNFPSNSVKVQNFKAGTLLCKKGTPGDRLYILTEGIAEVVIGGQNSNIVIDAPGSLIGEIAVFLNLGKSVPEMSRTADVICKTDISAIALQLSQVESFFSSQPEVMTKVLMAMVARTDKTKELCHNTEDRVREVLFKKLGIILDGLNKLAHALAKKKNTLAFNRPLTFCTQRSRAVFERFKESLKVLEARSKIRT